MRRGLSTLLVLFLGLGPLTAVLPASDDLRLPPCCRRNGMHHCAMAAMMEAMMARQLSSGKPLFTVPLTCPYYPGPAALLTPPAAAMAPTAISLPVSLESVHTPIVRRVVALFNPIRPHAGRGPPASQPS